MRQPRTIAASLVLFLMIGLTAGTALAQKGKGKAKEAVEKPPEKIFIPKEIKAMMAEGLATRQARQDIPFEIFRSIQLPAQNSLHTLLFFKLKNADLGFTASTAGDTMSADFNIFLQFLQPDQTGALKIYREFYVPTRLQEPAANFVVDKTEWYSVGTPLPYGKYTLAMAVTSPNLQKVGIVYYDLNVPGPETYQSSIDASALIVINDMQQMEKPELAVLTHKGSLTYSVIRITPNIDYVFAPGSTIDAFYFVYGAKSVADANGQAANDLEVQYSVRDLEGKVLIKWQVSNYTFSLIDQQLPLKQTVNIKDAKGERQEQRDLPVGKYELVINIKDKISGNTVEKKTPFEVK